jgi:hypothetical protein
MNLILVAISLTLSVSAMAKPIMFYTGYMTGPLSDQQASLLSYDESTQEYQSEWFREKQITRFGWLVKTIGLGNVILARNNETEILNLHEGRIYGLAGTITMQNYPCKGEFNSSNRFARGTNRTLQFKFDEKTKNFFIYEGEELIAPRPDMDALAVAENQLRAILENWIDSKSEVLNILNSSRQEPFSSDEDVLYSQIRDLLTKKWREKNLLADQYGSVFDVYQTNNYVPPLGIERIKDKYFGIEERYPVSIENLQGSLMGLDQDVDSCDRPPASRQRPNISPEEFKTFTRYRKYEIGGPGTSNSQKHDFIFQLSGPTGMVLIDAFGGIITRAPFIKE